MRKKIIEKFHLNSDILSGFMVFLLALPLSLGIAKASDFPAIAGIVTAIIGGMVVSLFVGSELTIKGPAAGLIVIASGAVEAFGGGEKGWHIALTAIVTAGVLQILFGICKFGKLSDLFPNAAIHGMLAAIGIIIMSKQLHILLGIPPGSLKGKEPLELLAMLPSSIMHENAHLTEIGIACLLILSIHSLIKNQNIKKIPAPLIVLAVAIPLGFALHIKTDGEISNFALVKVGSLSDIFKNGILNANFEGINGNWFVFFEYVILFSLIGSIESLLTVKAIDKKDPMKRKADTNKDLTAIGIGNTLAGLIGGLPMISEVARSSANVEYGAKSRWSNFFHGLFLLLAVLFAVSFIEMIPNTALAAMLIFVGFRLAHPREFKHIYAIGFDQLLIFVLTILTTLTTDLLIGVGTGMVMEILINLYHGMSIKNIFNASYSVSKVTENEIQLNIKNSLVFTNCYGFIQNMNRLSEPKNITVRLNDAKLIDHSSLVSLENFKQQFEKEGRNFKIIGHNQHHSISGHPHSTRKKSKIS